MKDVIDMHESIAPEPNDSNLTSTQRKVIDMTLYDFSQISQNAGDTSADELMRRRRERKRDRRIRQASVLSAVMNSKVVSLFPNALKEAQ